MLVTTDAIVIKTLKYGDTSLIGYVFTEALGLQTVMLKGVRTTKSKMGNAGIWQSGNLISLVIYHHPQKNFQIVKEFKPSCIFKNIPENIIKQCVMVFAMEVLNLYLQKDNKQSDLYFFTLKFLHTLDEVPVQYIANLPLYFLLNSGKLNGYIISGTYSAITCNVNIPEGRFSESVHSQYSLLESTEAQLLSDMIQESDIYNFMKMPISKSQRITLQTALIQFMEWHIPDFKPLKSLPVIRTVLN